jgi:ketosteroid isomerase-like protein
MIYRICVLGILIFFNIVNAQQRDLSRKSLIAAEYEFANYTTKNGTRDGFLKFISDDGILFRPKPVNGKQFLITSKPGKGYLSWYPSVAEVSENGDLGFTNGPWEYKVEKDSPAVGFGNFCTVWKKEKSGEWKFFIDIGNTTSKPDTPEKPLENVLPILSENIYPKKYARKISGELKIIDENFNKNLLDDNNSGLYKKFCDENSRLIYTGKFPVRGSADIVEYLKNENKKMIFKPIGGIVSSSNDIGAVYGSMEALKDNSVTINKCNYLRIWKKVNGNWVIAIEVVSELKE